MRCGQRGETVRRVCGSPGGVNPRRGGADRGIALTDSATSPRRRRSPAGYILQGPLLGSCGISEAEVSSELANWSRLGARLAKQLQFGNDLNAVEK